MGFSNVLSQSNGSVSEYWKMSGKGGRQVTNTGTNSQGSNYTSYSDGAFSYSNPSGSRYFNTGAGHGFYDSGSSGTQGSGGVPYTTHTNYNQGYSSTQYKSSK